MKIIQLTQEKYAIVDDEDYEELSKYRWQYHLGYAKRGEYDSTKRNNKSIKMHRQIMNPPKGMVVHHRNHNRLDNRKSNLMICTARENHLSQKSREKFSSKYQGVQLRKSCGSWNSYIKVNYRKIYLGQFKNEKHAAAAYNQAAIKYFGSFAVLNKGVGSYFPSKEARKKISLNNLHKKDVE